MRDRPINDDTIIGGGFGRTYGEIKEALEKTNGNMTNAAKFLGIQRTKLTTWAREYPEVGDLIKEAKKALLDKCISVAQAVALGIPLYENGKFVGWQEKPDSQMLRYFISTLGRDEGYGESLDVTSAGEKIGGIQVEIIDRRDQVMKKDDE